MAATTTTTTTINIRDGSGGAGRDHGEIPKRTRTLLRTRSRFSHISHFINKLQHFLHPLEARRGSVYPTLFGGENLAEKPRDFPFPLNSPLFFSSLLYPFLCFFFRTLFPSFFFISRLLLPFSFSLCLLSFFLSSFPLIFLLSFSSFSFLSFPFLFLHT